MSENAFQHFSKRDFQSRLELLQALHYIDKNAVEMLKDPQLPPLCLAEKWIENAIGYFPLPLGVAVNFIIDHKPYVLPMAVEETSIIAAASKIARWINQHGEITTHSCNHLNIGQIQIAKVKDLARLQSTLATHQAELIRQANDAVANGLVRRGGGIQRLELRTLKRPDGLDMAVIHVLVDTCDAMGANIINQVCEYLRIPLEELSGEKISMCILSNLGDQHLTEAHVTMQGLAAEIGEKIEEASIFAEIDSYRAATSNKGVLNGMDPILIATGNDWRAVEAGVHAFACQTGQYRSITRWRYQQGELRGELQAPIAVGIIGGVTQLHPLAKLSLNMLQVNKAEELARIVAAAGLVQNLGAIRALTQEGIIQGHMKLHIDNLLLSIGATEVETAILKTRLQDILIKTRRISLSQAQKLLQELRCSDKALSVSSLQDLLV